MHPGPYGAANVGERLGLAVPTGDDFSSAVGDICVAKLVRTLSRRAAVP